MDVWGPSEEDPLILNLPATVEMGPQMYMPIKSNGSVVT